MSLLHSAPAHWPRIALGELTASTRPICYGVLKPGPDVEGGIPLIRIQDLHDGTVSLKRLHYISHELDVEFGRSRLDGGEVLISIQGTIGRVAICPPSLAGANISRTIAVIRPDDRMRPEFLAHYLRLLADATAFPTQGATRASLNIGSLRALEVPAPDLAVQDIILAALNRAFANVDDGERHFLSALRGADIFKASVLAELRGSAEQVPIGDVAQVFGGATPSRQNADFWEGDIPWVSSGEVAFCRIAQTRETITTAGLGNPATRLHPPGTVLLAMIGEGKTRGQAAILDVSAAHNQNAASIRLDPDRMLPEYLFYCLMGQYEQNRLAGAGSQQPALNGELVRAIEVPCPPLDDQRALVDMAEERLRQYERLREGLSAQVDASRRLRTSLLYSAFTGNLADGPGMTSEEVASRKTLRAVPVGEYS